MHLLVLLYFANRCNEFTITRIRFYPHRHSIDERKKLKLTPQELLSKVVIRKYNCVLFSDVHGKWETNRPPLQKISLRIIRFSFNNKKTCVVHYKMFKRKHLSGIKWHIVQLYFCILFLSFQDCTYFNRADILRQV